MSRLCEAASERKWDLFEQYVQEGDDPNQTDKRPGVLISELILVFNFFSTPFLLGFGESASHHRLYQSSSIHPDALGIA